MIELLAENGYSPRAIQDCFRSIRTSRAGARHIERIVYGSAGQFDVDELRQMERDLFGTAADAGQRFGIWLSTHLRTKSKINASALNPKQGEKLRARFKRELEMRQIDAAYRQVASVAELIERPSRSGTRSLRLSLLLIPGRSARALTGFLMMGRLFGGIRRLAQLTGLDDRHTLDLLNGANAVNEVWWIFLAEVETAAAPGTSIETPKGEHPSFLQRLGIA